MIRQAQEDIARREIDLNLVNRVHHHSLLMQVLNIEAYYFSGFWTVTHTPYIVYVYVYTNLRL
jgi:hypothetical protein